MKQLNLRGTNVISGQIVSQAARDGYTEIAVDGGAVVTSLARDAAAVGGLVIVREGGPRPAAGRVAGASPVVGAGPAEAVYASAEAKAIKDEIVAAGKKIWRRGYVDGNGGNISCRLGEKYVLCTPTLLSKADMTPDDICLVDMEGNQLAGGR